MDSSTNTINNFLINAVEQDFSRDFLFRIISVNIDGVGDDRLQLGRDDLVFAKTGKLPGRVVGNTEVKYAGQTFNMPAAVSFPGADGYEIEFYCPESSYLREKLMNESTRTFGNQFGLAGTGSDGLGTIANRNSYILLNQLNKKLDPIYQYKLIGCSIRSVGDLAYQTAEGSGAVVSFTASIAYHFFERRRLGGEVYDFVNPINR
jgi:hypothetical protein